MIYNIRRLDKHYTKYTQQNLYFPKAFKLSCLRKQTYRIGQCQTDLLNRPISPRVELNVRLIFCRNIFDFHPVETMIYNVAFTSSMSTEWIALLFEIYLIETTVHLNLQANL